MKIFKHRSSWDTEDIVQDLIDYMFYKSKKLQRAIMIIEVSHWITCSPVFMCWVCIVGEVDFMLRGIRGIDISGAVYHLYTSEILLCPTEHMT